MILLKIEGIHPRFYMLYCGLLVPRRQPQGRRGAHHRRLAHYLRSARCAASSPSRLSTRPAVCVSSKEDSLAELVLTRRFSGLTGVIDHDRKTSHGLY